MFFIEAKRITVVIFGSFLLAISLNFFLINANVYASGFAGAAQLASSVIEDYLGISDQHRNSTTHLQYSGFYIRMVQSRTRIHHLQHCISYLCNAIYGNLTSFNRLG